MSAAARLGVCVLPFVNLSGDPEQDYFSDGISEDIITDLSKVSSLIVVSRNSAFTFKGKRIEVPEIARRLNVSHVLEGSVRKAGGRLRISAQLIDGARGGHVWAERFDRELNDVFAVQDEISRAIVGALRLRLLPEERKAIETRGTANIDAYNLYLMARKFYVNAALSSQRRYETIIRLCTRATEIDRNYASAWALMAIAQAGQHSTFGPGDGGLVAADRALALDATLADAHAARARALISNGDFAGATASVERAILLNPDSYEVQYAAAVLAFSQRRIADAQRHWEKCAGQVDSDYLSAGMLITCRTILGDRRGAQTAADSTLTRAERAIAQHPDNGTAMCFAVIALAALGEAERARNLTNRAILIDPDNAIMRYNMARAFVTNLADSKTALDLLEPAFEKLSQGQINWVRIEPDFDTLRETPRFQAMLTKAEARLAL